MYKGLRRRVVIVIANEQMIEKKRTLCLKKMNSNSC
jgi:hypothetical protein